MAAYTGYGGSVTFGTAVTIIRGWEIEDKADFEDSTGMASGASGRRSKTATLLDWSGSFDGVMDSAETKFKGASPTIRAGASGAATFAAGAMGNYSGTILITNVTTRTPVDGLVEFTVQFEGSGDLTYPA